MEIKSVEKLKEEVSKRKDIPEGEKGSLMERIRKLEQETDELVVKIGSVEMGINSFEKLKGEVSKSKDISAGGKGSLMEKIRKLKQEKESVKMEIKSFKKIKGGKEKDNEEELQTLRSQVDELQTKVGRVQKEKDNLWKEKEQLQKENEWRRAHKYADDITVNPDTAHPNLSISEDKKKFIHEAQPQNVPPTPERFDSTVCVLGSEGFSSGEHYWEVDARSSTDWDLGVASKVIKRKGKLSLSPKEGFWVLGWSGRDYWAKTDPWTRVMVQKKPKKIGIYLSYQERQVTFFNVTDMSVLFTFKDCSFSGEIYPFFKNSHKETSIKICSIREDE